MNVLIVFLDIDGVLRRTTAPKYQLQKDLVENLSRWVAEQEMKLGKEIEIVISSTWKDVFSLNYIRNLFPIDLRSKIVAVTPSLNGPYGEYPRFMEVMHYVNQHKTENWIAFDDQPTLYPPNLSNVVIIDGEKGFQL